MLSNIIYNDGVWFLDLHATYSYTECNERDFCSSIRTGVCIQRGLQCRIIPT